jgi:hypothetical protein
MQEIDREALQGYLEECKEHLEKSRDAIARTRKKSGST